MFEHYSKPLLGRAQYHQRLFNAASLAALLVGLSLGAGMWGYHVLEGMPWIDAFLSASMILSGMGPVGDARGDGVAHAQRLRAHRRMPKKASIPAVVSRATRIP